MKSKIYLETTILSYLCAWRSQDLIVAANQEATRQWWDEARHRYDIFISDVVLEEAKEGNKEAANQRLKFAADIPEFALRLN